MKQLWDNYISNKNLDEFEDWESVNLYIKKNNDSVEVSFKNTYSVNIFSYEEGSDFYLSFNPNTLIDKFGKYTIRHKDLFSKLIITKDKYSFEFSEHTVGTVRDRSEEAGQIIQNWVDKYRKIIFDIDPSEMIMEVSAGFDTRNLTYLWRYNGNKYDIYTKNDPDEVNEALQVIALLPRNHVYVGNKPLNRITLSGANIISRSVLFNINTMWCDKIANPEYCHKSYHILYGITPYYDKEYLKIYCRIPTQLKFVLAYLFTKDHPLFKIPYMSFMREHVKIDRRFESKVMFVISKWKNIDNF